MRYRIAPATVDDIEAFYYEVIDDDGMSGGWESLGYGESDRDFKDEFDALSREILFTGEIYILESPKHFLVGKYPYVDVNESDRVVRGFQRGTKVKVLQVLRDAAYVLHDPENDATQHQGAIRSIEIDRSATIPTLKFT